jgi:hypothetical protein
MAAIVGALRADLSADVGGFASDMGRAGGVVDNFAARTGQVGRGMMAVGAGMTAGITVPLIMFGSESVKAFAAAEQGASQTRAALESMGNASGRSFEQLYAAADDAQRKYAVDNDEVLQRVTANLLTFGNVAGAQFDRAQVAAIDLSRRLGTDLQASTLMVGKALNDPVKGLAALRRVGIQFTADQQAVIKAMVETGDVAGAQGVMLTELERQFGGAGAAYAATAAGQAEATRLAFGDMQEVFGQLIAEIGVPLLTAVRDVLQAFLSLDPGMQKIIFAGLALLAALGPIIGILGGLLTILATVGPAMAVLAPIFAGLGVAAGAAGGIIMGTLGAALAFILSPIGLVVAAVAALIAIWVFFGDDIQRVVGHVWQWLQGKFAELVQWLGGLVESVTKWWADVSAVFARVAPGIVQFLMTPLRGLFNLWKTQWDTAVFVVTQVVPRVLEAVRGLYEGVNTWLRQRLGAVLNWVMDKAKAVGDAFFSLYDRVVGHSYVPDMVDGIADEFARLPDVMVQPALDATDTVGQSFADMGKRVADSFTDLLFSGEMSMSKLGEMSRSLGKDLFQRPFMDWAKGGVSSALSGLFGGGGGGGLGGMFSGLFGGFRAMGGDVAAGMSYVVGENGPEVFRPNVGGSITANGAGGGVTVNQYISTPDAGSFRRSQRQVAGAAKRSLSAA